MYNVHSIFKMKMFFCDVIEFEGDTDYLYLCKGSTLHAAVHSFFLANVGFTCCGTDEWGLKCALKKWNQ